ncbi:methyltransferase domain-containing protein [Nocardioides montaniterrae]
MDVLLDGQRVWSFNPAREGTPAGRGIKVPWPKALVPYLTGTAEVCLVEHSTGEVLHRQEVAFTDSAARTAVVDQAGNALAVDKGGRMQRDFSNTADSAREEVVDALHRVLHDLVEECGLDAYLMYGCLLGAVRDGHLIGHDSDADLAYLSRHEHPFDVIRECSAAIKRMRALGWRVVRLSGANFKVWVETGGDRRVGIDVFGSFFVGDRFHVTGSLTGPLDRAALLPFGTVTLEGREIVAPARPEDVLAFTYGPGWRTPDPAFHFDHDPRDVQRMSSWFRAQRRRARLWEDFYKSPRSREVPEGPSTFAEWVQERLAPRGATHLLDVGAGTGRDARFFAEQGHRVEAFDFTTRALEQTRARLARGAKRFAVRRLNLEDLHGMLLAGATYAHREEVCDIYARGLLDALDPNARSNFWRFASMAQRRGGETYVEFRTPASRYDRFAFGKHRRTFVPPARAVREIESYGGTVVQSVVSRGLARLGDENPEICRLVVRWDR